MKIGPRCTNDNTELLPWDSSRIYPQAEQQSIVWRCPKCGYTVPMSYDDRKKFLEEPDDKL